MRTLIVALLLAGCSAVPGSAPQSAGHGQAQQTPRPAAAELNLPGSVPGPGPAVSGPGGGSLPNPEAPTLQTPVPGSPSTPGRPPIEPGLSRLPGYQASLWVRDSVQTGTVGDSVARGFQLYGKACAMCHGDDLRGKASSNSETLRDLTHSKEYRFGSSDQALYRTLVYGIPRTAMGNYEHVLKVEQVWDLIHFMKSRRVD